MKRLFGAALAMLFLGVQSPASAQTIQCELHIWPTKVLGAVFNGATVGWSGAGAVVTGMYLTPMEEMKQKVEEYIGEADQVKAIQALDLGGSGKFSGYRLVFHPAPDKPKYSNADFGDAADVGRNAQSNAPCYAEVHVLFITLFRTAMSKKLQSAFLYRGFGGTALMTSKSFFPGSTGAPAFPPKDGEDGTNARADIYAAFQKNLLNCLQKKKVIVQR